MAEVELVEEHDRDLDHEQDRGDGGEDGHSGQLAGGEEGFALCVGHGECLLEVRLPPMAFSHQGQPHQKAAGCSSRIRTLAERPFTVGPGVAPGRGGAKAPPSRTVPPVGNFTLPRRSHLCWVYGCMIARRASRVKRARKFASNSRVSWYNKHAHSTRCAPPGLNRPTRKRLRRIFHGVHRKDHP